MNKIDPDKVFSIFNQTDDQVLLQDQIQQIANDTRTLLMDIVQQLHRYDLIDIIYSNKQGNQYSKVQDKIKLKYFTRLFDQLTQIDIQQVEKQHNLLQAHDNTQCIQGLYNLIKYFEQIEDYRKCAIIIKYINKLNKNNKKSC